MNFRESLAGKVGSLPGNGVDADVDGLHRPQHDGVQGNEKKRRIENFQNNASNNYNESECKLGERISCEDSPHESL
jgi:hypothetical protein